MARLYDKQAEQYSYRRPTYPEELYQFIASKTERRDLAWDVGTGNGQAARALAGIFKNVVATDTSPKQLEFAAKLANIRYQCTPPNMPISELEQNVAPESSVDLVTIATALHWFDLPTFFQQVKWVLKKPNGVIAAWTTTTGEIRASPALNALLQQVYVKVLPYFESQAARDIVLNKYRTIDFPFRAVEGLDHTGPFEFKTEKSMGLDDLFDYVKTLAPYQTAKNKGVEILSDDVVEKITQAWNEDGNPTHTVTFPVNLRIGKVGN